jgi:hypothetical protein
VIDTGVTNGRTEAGVKRTGRGYRNSAHYQARLLLGSAARRAA